MKYSHYILLGLFLLLFFSCKKEAAQNKWTPAYISGKWKLQKENIIEYSYPNGVKRIDTFVYKTGIFTNTVPDTPNPIIVTVNIANSLQFNVDGSFIGSDNYLITSTLSNGVPGYAADTIRGKYKITQNKLDLGDFYKPLGLEYNDYGNGSAGNSSSIPIYPTIAPGSNIQVTTLTSNSMVLHTDYTYGSFMLEFITHYYYTR